MEKEKHKTNVIISQKARDIIRELQAEIEREHKVRLTIAQVIDAFVAVASKDKVKETLDEVAAQN